MENGPYEQNETGKVESTKGEKYKEVFALKKQAYAKEH